MTMRDKLHVSAGGKVLGRLPGAGEGDHQELPATDAGLALLAAADAAAQRAALGLPTFARLPAGPGKAGLGYTVLPPDNFNLGSTLTLVSGREYYIPAYSDPREGPANRLVFRVNTASADAVVRLRVMGGDANPGPSAFLSELMTLPVTGTGQVPVTPSMLSGAAWESRAELFYAVACTFVTTAPVLLRLDGLTRPSRLVAPNLGAGKHLHRDGVVSGSLLAAVPAYADLTVETGSTATPGLAFGYAP